MGMISEFKVFIAKGNVMDLAVGVIIGGAFVLLLILWWQMSSRQLC
jgi:large-conductance mechanosensitive channel